ncbi:MAG: S-layer protein domain-containing protein [Candidatus Methanoperedens sp.]|nr:S-layer protein domain-containing protein [Candidatus Methanoperedens sp. BLZ2]MBZ0174339.1 hypothetical protein [Candidatus Methanoperedens nitroreducens]MCX9079873.1 S-layer protein domain-containing protein [Candidatus Methanoperedens sp.]
MVKGKYVLEIAIVLLIMSLIPAAIAAPDITSWGNNKTNNNTPTISISIGDTIRFNATANETLSPWEWYVDNVITKSATSGTSDIFDYTFNAIKTYTVKVNGSNGSNASDTISWTVTVQAAPPATSKPTITSWGNTKTNNSSLSIEINRTESVTFNATANQTINTWNWFLNGNNTLTNNSSFTYQFNNGGSHTVSVNGTNTTNGTTDNTTVWNIQVIDNEPPGNITLSTNTSGTTWINWIWTNPPDFNFAMVYIDEIWKRNVNTNTYNTSPDFTFLPNTRHNISLRPVDFSNNIGNWTNGSATTTTQKPIITRISPSDPVNSTGIENKTFVIQLDQIANVTWTGAKSQSNLSINGLVNLTFTPTSTGLNTISVSASNDNGTSNTIIWNWSVHPTTFSTGNRIWDGSKPIDFDRTYTWTPQSFSGFYYNAKDDVGTENITITMDSYSSRTIGTNKLVYSTSPQEVSFAHSLWGKYQVIGFMADKYFAGYTSNTSSTNTRPTTDFSGISALAQGGLHKVLIDDDTKQTIAVGGTLALRDGYVLKATDIDMNARQMLLSLLKDGSQVDVSPLSAGETYVYTKTVGGVENLPLIMVRFDSVFAGQELQTAFIKGLFQISEDTTVVRAGDQFGNMKVDSVDLSGIRMKNSANIGLSKGTTATVMGDVKIQVANNDSAVRFALTVDRPSNLEVRSTVYKDGNPLEWTPYNFGMNIGDTSVGFYYDLDEGVGGENLKLINPVSGRSIPADGLEYSTTPQEVKFTYTGFGKYQAIGFMADRYFAGYTSNTLTNIITRPTTDFDGISTIANGNLNKVLIDDDTKTTIAVGSTIALQEGYVLKATDIDLNARQMLLTLLKDGTEVDVSPLSAGETYIYTKTIGGTENLPLIMVRFENVFSGGELQVAFLKGIFQISENPTKIEVGNQFGSMEVISVDSNIIKMSNSGSIGLSKNTNNALMGNIKLKVADNDALRFYFAVDVTPEMIVNQLSISAPTKVMAGDTLKIKVTAGGKAVNNTTLSLDTDMGPTDINGELNYTIPKTLKPGTYTITAAKTGYEKATKSIEVEKYVDLRLSIEAPSKANQYETITIKVLYNGTAMSGAAVLFDNTSAGTTDSNGEVSYKLETSGTHTITASKASYITVSTDIDIRAPYSEFKALDINITPNPVFAGEDFVVRSNITNVGTKSDTLPVDLVINDTAVDNRTITLTPGQTVEINFTRQESLAMNVTVEILGQSNLLVVQEKPTNYFLIAVIATAIGAVIIYVLTSKGLLSIEILKQKFALLGDKFSNLFKK